MTITTSFPIEISVGATTYTSTRVFFDRTESTLYVAEELNKLVTNIHEFKLASGGLTKGSTQAEDVINGIVEGEEALLVNGYHKGCGCGAILKSLATLAHVKQKLTNDAVLVKQVKIDEVKRDELKKKRLERVEAKKQKQLAARKRAAETRAASIKARQERKAAKAAEAT